MEIMNGEMGIPMRVHLLMGKWNEMDFINGKKEMNMKVNIKII